MAGNKTGRGAQGFWKYYIYILHSTYNVKCTSKVFKKKCQMLMLSRTDPAGRSTDWFD